jgi:hypothetical protein
MPLKIPIQLYRPPVVLIHGVWTNSEQTWAATDSIGIVCRSINDATNVPVDKTINIVFSMSMHPELSCQ